MKRNNTQHVGMASRCVYQIVVRGILDEHWRDWFNGALLEVEQERYGFSKTTLTCQIRDQAELMGILNRLYSLNMPLLALNLFEMDHKNRSDTVSEPTSSNN